MIFQVEYQNWISEWPFWYSFWYSEKLKKCRKMTQIASYLTLVGDFDMVGTFLGHSKPKIRLWFFKLNIRIEYQNGHSDIHSDIRKSWKSAGKWPKLLPVLHWLVILTWLAHFYIFFFSIFENATRKQNFLWFSWYHTQNLRIKILIILVKKSTF